MVWQLTIGLFVLGIGSAAAQTADTGRICAVAIASPGKPGEGMAAAAARSVQAQHCQAGDVLELTYTETNPVPAMAQLCDFSRQIHTYTPPPSFAQVGITSELVCSLVGARRTNR